ncbi:MAG: protein translocase subunit SecF, partial [Hyphomicrobiales bacterium]
MKPIQFIPAGTKIRFTAVRNIAFAVSGALAILSLIMTVALGLNFGIDFRGGTTIEIQTKDGPANIAKLRAQLGGLGLGEVQIQEFGTPTEV